MTEIAISRENATDTAMPGTEVATEQDMRSLFVFSVDQRDELSALLSGLGFLTSGSRRAQSLVSRLSALDQLLVIIDLRTSDPETVIALDRLKKSPLGFRHKYIGLLNARTTSPDETMLAGLDWVGWLVDTWSEQDISSVIKHSSLTLDRRSRTLEQQISWRWDGKTLQLSPALAELVGDGGSTRTKVFRLLDEIGQQRFWLTLQALGGQGTHRAFVHELTGRRAIHQIQRIGNALAGHIHWLDVVESGDRRVPAQRPMDDELERAVREDGIVVFFQPQFDTAHHRLIGAEALARWDHKQLGLIGAETLFSMAERLNLGLPLSRRITESALHAAVGWGAALSDLKLSINVTAAELDETDYAEWLIKALEQTGFAADRLVLEITEQALIGDLEKVSSVLNSLTSKGISVAIDDFGTGYANFAYIKALPVSTLKLDRSLIEMLEYAAKDRIIVGSIISMASELGVDVLAEGVETDSQLAILSDLGAATVQGYLFGEPMPSEDFEAFALRSN